MERSSDTVVVQSDSSGWVVTVIILLAVIGGGAYWYMHMPQAQTPARDAASIQIQLPSGSTSGGDQQPQQ